jgi:hypothetical protein
MKIYNIHLLLILLLRSALVGSPVVHFSTRKIDASCFDATTLTGPHPSSLTDLPSPLSVFFQDCRDDTAASALPLGCALLLLLLLRR